MNFRFIAMLALMHTCCKSPQDSDSVNHDQIEDTKEITRWIASKNYQASIVYQKQDDDFHEILRLGKLSSSLERYVDEKSFDLFHEDKIERVIVILSRYEQTDESGNINISFRSVIDGSVTLVSGDEKITIEESKFIDAMRQAVND